nr:class I SAM-dependent methyltransferase [Lamprobacter modestohalophilus]
MARCSVVSRLSASVGRCAVSRPDSVAARGGDDVLDLGAGAGIVTEMNFCGHARRICGIDPDPRVVDNPFLDEGKVGLGESIPYPDASFDLVFADNVLEHLPNPEQVFAEVARVLRPGGVFLAKTPNKYHYVPLIARLTPHGFHRWVVRWRGREGEDVFPTRYLANSRADIRRLAAATGLQVVAVDLVEGRPEYLRFSALTYVFGYLYERLVNLVPGLAGLRVLLVAELRKPDAGSAA